MALTATATKSTQQSICRSLAMKNVVIISESPNKLNLKYHAQTVSQSIEDTFAPLVEQIKQQQTSMGKVIIFCANYNAFINSSRAGLEKKSQFPTIIASPTSAWECFGYC